MSTVGQRHIRLEPCSTGTRSRRGPSSKERLLHSTAPSVHTDMRSALHSCMPLHWGAGGARMSPAATRSEPRGAPRQCQARTCARTEDREGGVMDRGGGGRETTHGRRSPAALPFSCSSCTAACGEQGSSSALPSAPVVDSASGANSVVSLPPPGAGAAASSVDRASPGAAGE